MFSAAQSNGRLFLDYLPEWCQKEKTDVGGTALKGQTGQIKGK